MATKSGITCSIDPTKKASRATRTPLEAEAYLRMEPNLCHSASWGRHELLCNLFRVHQELPRHRHRSRCKQAARWYLGVRGKGRTVFYGRSGCWLIFAVMVECAARKLTPSNFEKKMTLLLVVVHVVKSETSCFVGGIKCSTRI